MIRAIEALIITLVITVLGVTTFPALATLNVNSATTFLEDRGYFVFAQDIGELAVLTNGTRPWTADQPVGSNSLTGIATASGDTASFSSFTNGTSTPTFDNYQDLTITNNEAGYYDFVVNGAWVPNSRNIIRQYLMNAVDEPTLAAQYSVRMEDGTDGLEYATWELCVMRAGGCVELLDFDTNSKIIAWNDAGIDISHSMECDDIAWCWFLDGTGNGAFWFGEATTTPDGNVKAKLHITDDVVMGSGATPPTNTIAFFEDGDGPAFLNVIGGAAKPSGLYLGVPSDTDKAGVIHDDNVSGDPLYLRQDNGNRLTIKSSGTELDSGDWFQMGGGAPVGTECDDGTEEGRLWVDTTNGIFYVCDQTGASTGWAQVLDFSS